MNLVYFLGVLLVQCLTPVSLLSAGWIDYTFSAGVYCSSQTSICHTLAHFVLWAVPDSSIVNILQGVGYVSVDGAEFIGHSQLNYEQHNIWIGNERAQVFNFQYDRTWSVEDGTKDLPEIICVKALLVDTISEDKLMMDEACKKVDYDNMLMNTNAVERSWYLHGNSTKECSVESSTCRTMAHVVLRAAAVGNDPMDTIKGGGEFSVDGGLTWTSAGGQGLMFENQMVLHSDGQLYQGSNWGFDQLSPYREEEETLDICWRVWVTNTNTGSQPQYVDMGEEDGGYMGYQISQYERCFVTEFIVHE